MRLREHYDWVVLGDHPGALLSASLAARLGLSVLVLPLSPSLGLTLSKSGQYLDPESNLMMGLGSGEKVNGLLWDCLHKLGILPFEEQLILDKETMPQVVTPSSRLVFGQGETLQAELVREFGKDSARALGLVPAVKYAGPEYLGYWAGLPKRLTLTSNSASKSRDGSSLNDIRKKLSRNPHFGDGPTRTWVSSKKTVSDLARELGRSELTEVCSGIWYSVTGGAQEDPTLPDMLHVLSQAHATATFKGGMTAYREFLTNLARRLGVQVPLKSDCRRIFIENGRFVGVQISSRGNMIGASAGILGCSIKKALPRTTFSGRNWFHRFKKPPQPMGWKFTIALTVHAEAIPPGMRTRLIWKEKNAPALELEYVHPSDFGVKAPEQRIVFLRTVLPFTEESLTPHYQQLIAGRMMRQLTEVMPFVDFHVVRIFPDFRTRQIQAPTEAVTAQAALTSPVVAQSELSEIYGFATTELIPDNLRVYGDQGIGCRSGVEGLFVGSDEAYPELGSLGGTVAALESIALIAHRSGLAGPFV